MIVRFLRSSLFRYLIVLIALVFCWIKSFDQGDLVAFYTPAGNLQVLGSHRGVVTIFFSNISFGSRERGLTFDHEACRHDDYEEIEKDLIANGPTPARFHSFSIGHSAADVFGFHGGWFRYVTVPYAALVPIIFALWAIPALRRTLKSRTRQRRLRLGLCPQCGYDTRFSAGRCPECGYALADVPSQAAV